MGVKVDNLSAAEDIANFHVPTRPDGTFYRYEMVTDGGWSRYYDDDSAALVGFLISGYAALTDPTDRLAARIQHAVDLQVRLQARLNVFFADYPRTDEEQRILTAPRSTPPRVEDWTSDIPLVLVDAFYSPHGQLPLPDAPQPLLDDAPPTIWWLRPAGSDLDYLRSLHAASLIDLNINIDGAP